MVKDEYISCLYQLFNLPLEIVERIVYYFYTHQSNTFKLRERTKLCGILYIWRL